MPHRQVKRGPGENLTGGLAKAEKSRNDSFRILLLSRELKDR